MYKNKLNLYKDYLKDYRLILLYSGYYDEEFLLDFVIPSNFFYITNLDIPNLILMYDLLDNNINIFLDNKNSDWIDYNEYYDKIYNIFSNNIKIQNYNDFNKIIKKYKNKKIATLKETLFPKFINLNDNIIDYNILDKICNNKRITKSFKEINEIYKAVKLTTTSFKFIFSNISKFSYPYQIINFFKFICGNYGQLKMAYKPICTSGSDNSILHSNNYTKKLQNNQLILLDIGCKFNNYCSDITRTFPINGRFNKSQREIYNIVLEANIYCINNSKINTIWNELSNKCFIIIYEGLLKLDIVKKVSDLYKKIDLGKLFMKHSLGHNIGIDVHDVCSILVLKENMVITIEPGIYFSDEQCLNKNVNKSVWKKYKNIGGIRIEDVILINKYKTINLSLNLPKKIEEIEKLLLI
tara:strand:- start:1500 stop:2732 length:1233 start_codon:yes stop_codon:yes gene_type:complete